VPDIGALPAGSNTVTLNGLIYDQTGSLHQSSFAAFPVTADSVPPDDFESLAANNLPAGWQTFWTDSQGGGAWLYDSNGQDSFSGNSVLRLHVGAGGGSTFVLSDPIDINPDQFYALTVQMQYFFNSSTQVACFTVLQYGLGGE